jgi:hypothetical protein
MSSRFSPLWIASKLAVNERDARYDTLELADFVAHRAAERVVVAGGEVRIVCVKAFYAA